MLHNCEKNRDTKSFPLILRTQRVIPLHILIHSKSCFLKKNGFFYDPCTILAKAQKSPWVTAIAQISKQKPTKENSTKKSWDCFVEVVPSAPEKKTNSYKHVYSYYLYNILFLKNVCVRVCCVFCFPKWAENKEMRHNSIFIIISSQLDAQNNNIVMIKKKQQHERVKT
jgi:hypothetical protein